MANQRVFVTGGGGFVGRHVVEELRTRGYRVRVLVRRRPVGRPEVEAVHGDTDDLRGLTQGFRDCDAVIHLIGIIRETAGQTFEGVHQGSTLGVIHAAREAGVRRLVHMSALGVRPDSASRYLTTKFLAEEDVRRSGLDWTIFRPSVIHGPDGEFVRMVADFARGRTLPYVFMPYFGVGLIGHTPRELQPVDVRDVARASVDAVQRPDLVGQTINLVGSQVVDWRQVYQVIGEAATSRPRPTVGIPAWYARMLTALLPKAWLPFNTSQVVMAAEDNVADVAETARQLGWTPRPFASSFREAWAASKKIRQDNATARNGSRQ